MNKQEKLGALYQKIKADYLHPKNARWVNSDILMQRSYQEVAALLYFEQLCQANDIYMVSEEWIKQMDKFACSGHPNTRMFSVAYDVTVDLNDYLLTL